MDNYSMKKIIEVKQRIETIVIWQDEEGREHRIVTDSVERPIPIPYEQ